MDQDNKNITFFFKKSNLFRVVIADGAWGGLTHELDVFFSLYNSRPPIPEILVHPIKEDGTLGKEIPSLKVSKNGIVREVEVGIVMKQENVRALIDFLNGMLEQAEKISHAQKERGVSASDAKEQR